MDVQQRRFVTGIFLAILLVGFCSSPQFRFVYELPSHMRIMAGGDQHLQVYFPLEVRMEPLQEAQATLRWPAWYQQVSLDESAGGKKQLVFSLLGIVPLRTVEVDVLPPLTVIPGGHSIGIVLHSQGVMVVGISPVKNGQGDEVIPAKLAGIMPGDVLLTINGQALASDQVAANIIDKAGASGQPLEVVLQRRDEIKTVKLTPVWCADTGRYRIGLFIRDSAAGVGTLTFYEPQSHRYGALGHVITDSNTNQAVNCEQGKIVLAAVAGVEQGRRGHPGEKVGLFIDNNELVGDIQKNTSFGIYGAISSEISNVFYPQGLPVASMNQVQLGEAEILTVVDGQNIERFQISIEKVNLQEAPGTKGLVIQITDPRLLAKTGGIIQGMSGSPIIQNGRLIGAVTHVFIHDPTKGYGCFIDWMLMESGLIEKKQQQPAAKWFTSRAAAILCRFMS